MLEDWQSNLKGAMDSTTAGSGDELVDTQEARALWEDVNLETAVAPLFNTIQMPSNPFQIPLQLGDVDWYPGTENTAAESTALATARQTLTAYELVAEVPWSYDLDEDAVIAMMEELRRGLLRNAREVIDDVILNGDTTALNNINADGSSVRTSDAGKAHWLLGFDGLLHLPLVDNTSQANNHNAAVTDDMFNEVRAKLGKYGVRPSEAVYVTDVNTFIRALGVGNFRTLDKFGPQATLLTGQLGAVEGNPGDRVGTNGLGRHRRQGHRRRQRHQHWPPAHRQPQPMAGRIQTGTDHRNGARRPEAPEHHGGQLPGSASRKGAATGPPPPIPRCSTTLPGSRRP